MNAYIESVIEKCKKRDGNEKEFIQTVEEVLRSLETVIEQHPEYEKAALLERLVEPERTIEFRVVWVDDAGKVNVNRGYRVQFNSAIGPYKGGLRFASHVNLSVMKFLGFEQTFKNSLTSLPMGGGKGGSDFDPNGKSDAEIMRFCQAFMTELYRHIGPSIDVPAGDIGVGGREIGYLFGQYKRIRGAYENGVLTGKGLSYGGSLIRPEATGFGAIYYVCEVLKHEHDTIEGKTIIMSGFGNVAWGIATKASQLGAKVVTLSGPDGYCYDPDGICTQEKLDYMLEMRASGRNRAQDLMGKGLVVAPSKAVNAGGVATSGLEMSQNSERLAWKAEEVDTQLHHIMTNIHAASAKAAEECGLGYNLVAGANIAGFKKVADAMMAQGLV